MSENSKILLERGVEEVIVKENLEKPKKKLRVKFGIDPTAPNLHLGHAVLLRKLRQFQDAGHQAILIIGDLTALIGDPSGRVSSRKPLTKAEVRKNEKKYLEQAGKILNLRKLEVRHNSEWLKKLKAADFLNLFSKFTLPQLVEREDFQKRIAAGLEVGGHEQFYPVFQAYDSVAVKADLEIGGRDQKLNLLAGRHLMEKLGMKPQDILLTPLLEGTDGVRKMSKSFDNYIGLTENPDEMFGKVMSLPDSIMPKYFELLTDIDPIPVKTIKKEPRNAKLLLAKTIVAYLHNQEASVRAMERFIQMFSKKEVPTDIPLLRISEGNWQITDILLKAGVKSKSEAKRLIEQGAVKVDDKVRKDINESVKLEQGSVIKIGKKIFFKIT